MGAANAKQLLVASKSRVCLTDAALHKTGSEHISRSSARHVQLDRVHQKPAPVLKKGLKSCQEEAIRCHLAPTYALANSTFGIEEEVKISCRIRTISAVRKSGTAGEGKLETCSFLFFDRSFACLT